MTAADPALINFLKEVERFGVYEDAAVKAKWGDDAVEVVQSSLLRDAAAAATEAQRQQGITGNVLARDQVRLKGIFEGLEGKTVTVKYPRLGYAAGRSFLVAAAAHDRDSNETILEGFVIL
ncbi:MAG: hypothetical protein DCC73_12010 [Proteobacteria bacterium]|nr:MAG: hypothetical protein DCC73_12010 [Pseudomonadota bacterium]